jgi:hypothetical protein
MEDGSMFNATYFDIRKVVRAKAEVMKAKRNTDTIILELVFDFGIFIAE